MSNRSCVAEGAMPGHNKRAKAQEASNKERRAERYNARPRYSLFGRKRAQHHHNGRGNEGGYLSSRTDQRQNHTAHTFNDVDPLDRQLFDFLLVVDVEATCEKDTRNYPNEVIELPAILVDVRRGVVDRKRSFHTYIKPWRNPVLTDFCKELTGIRQEDVDSAPTITEAVKLFEKWYRETIPKGAKVVFAADGPWDFKSFLHDCHVVRDHVSFPTIFYEYLDIRTTFAHHFNHGAPIKLDAMLRRMNLKFDGRPHCGFDDAYNIARLAVAMMRAGCVLDFLLAIPLDDEFHYEMKGYPVYRRAEGSGHVDRDMVDDIAKNCFGSDYFKFGEQHREETRRYRAEHPSQFINGNAVTLKRRADRLAAQRRREWLQLVGLLLLVVVGCAAVVFFAVRLCSSPRASVSKEPSDTVQGD